MNEILLKNPLLVFRGQVKSNFKTSIYKKFDSIKKNLNCET